MDNVKRILPLVTKAFVDEIDYATNIITETASDAATLRITSATLDSKWKKLEETLDDYMRLLHQQDATGADDAVTDEFNRTFKAKNRFEDQYQEHRIKLQVEGKENE